MDPFLVLAFGTVFIVDQAAKALIVRARPAGGAAPIAAIGPVRIVRVDNGRPALAMLRHTAVLVTAWAVMVGATVLLPPALRAGGAAATGLGLALGGATSNLLDRLGRHAVIDFIDIRVWPVFNLGDAAIVAGVALTVWGWR